MLIEIYICTRASESKSIETRRVRKVNISKKCVIPKTSTDNDRKYSRKS